MLPPGGRVAHADEGGGEASVDGEPLVAGQLEEDGGDDADAVVRRLQRQRADVAGRHRCRRLHRRAAGQQDQHAAERTRRHRAHLQLAMVLRAVRVDRLLQLPQHDADGEEEEEAREEDGEEDEQVDARLVLSEEQAAVARVTRVVVRRRWPPPLPSPPPAVPPPPLAPPHPVQYQVEARHVQPVDVVRQDDDEPMTHVAHHEERVRPVERDKRVQLLAGAHDAPRVDVVRRVRRVRRRRVRRRPGGGGGGTSLTRHHRRRVVALTRRQEVGVAPASHRVLLVDADVVCAEGVDVDAVRVVQRREVDVDRCNTRDRGDTFSFLLCSLSSAGRQTRPVA